MTWCLGNREHPFVGERTASVTPPGLGSFLFPFVPHVLFAKDRWISPNMLPAWAGAHASQTDMNPPLISGVDFWLNPSPSML